MWRCNIYMWTGVYLNSTDRIQSKQTNIWKQQKNYCCILNNYEILVDNRRYVVFLWNQSKRWIMDFHLPLLYTQITNSIIILGLLYAPRNLFHGCLDLFCQRSKLDVITPGAGGNHMRNLTIMKVFLEYILSRLFFWCHRIKHLTFNPFTQLFFP
jgi:hypothetical protein